jgi:hypothetical protein
MMSAPQRGTLKHSSIAAFLGFAVLVPFLALTPACGGGGRGAAERPVVGVKIYEAAPPFDGLFRQWRDLGINTLFVSEALLTNAEFRALARADRLRIFLIYPVFQSPEAIKEDPKIAAITASGAPARDEWVEFVCPTKGDSYLERRIGHLRNLITEGDPDVVSLDFIRFFVFWEKVAPDRTSESLPQTCFCPYCLGFFQKECNVHVPADLAGTAEKAKWILENHMAEWADWKCGRIANAVTRLAKAAREVKPSVQINLHAVPWRRGDFGGAIRSVAGQDFAVLAPLVDIISPMTYHHMVRQTSAWVHDVVADISAQTKGAPVLPSIQVSEAYIEDKLSADEFQTALEQALRPPSKGVVLWSWDALAKSPEKQAILRRLVH